MSLREWLYRLDERFGAGSRGPQLWPRERKLIIDAAQQGRLHELDAELLRRSRAWARIVSKSVTERQKRLISVAIVFGLVVGVIAILLGAGWMFLGLLVVNVVMQLLIRRWVSRQAGVILAALPPSPRPSAAGSAR